MKRFYLPTFLLLAAYFPLWGQPVRINEAVASNCVLQDEDGDFPDWFELYNADTTAISLFHWTCSDDPLEPGKWVFPNLDLPAGGYLQIWASGKDRGNNQLFRTLVNQGDVVRYLAPTTTVDSQWTKLPFDDSNWNEGPTGIGYGDGDDATETGVAISAFLRKTFSISDASIVQALILDVDYDDAFVAYINGQEVARANISGLAPAYNATALTDHEAQMYSGGLPERFAIDAMEGLLQDGENVLCIQTHNISAGSSDLSMIPFLTAVYNAPTNDGIEPPAILDLGNEEILHTNFKISASGETLYLFDNTGTLADSLVLPALPSNISYGVPDGQPGVLHYFDLLTPGAVNPGSGYQGICPNDILFSHPGGPTGPLSLALSGIDTPAVVRYTLDATPPTESSPIYTDPLAINSNTVVRARVFRVDYLPSATQSRTYLLNASHDLPVIALVADPPDFFDEETGIYVFGDSYEPDLPYFGANFWEDWERPIHFSLYEEDGTLGAAFDGGVKIFGAWSRANDQRSLAFFARDEYGFGAFDYPFFPDQPYDTYQAFVLRNSGNDWNNTMLRDAALTGLLKGADIEYQAYRPVASYLNGQYWGLYNLREKINEHFLASKWNVSPDDIDLLEGNGSVLHGSNEDYLDLVNFISTQNLSAPANYNYVAGELDLENFALYQTAEIYFDNTDWPGNNRKFGRRKGGKWRWILFDVDFGFGPWNNTSYTNNTLAFALEPYGPFWPNPPWSTLFFRKLTAQTTFRNLFVNRFADELNSRFLPERVSAHIDSLAARIKDEIPAHYLRWGASSWNWQNQVNNMKNFANKRPSYVKGHILSVFSLPAYHKLTIEIEDPDEGYVQVNSLTIKEPVWKGDYFQEVPIVVRAVAKPGYIFSHWISSPTSFGNNPELTINMKSLLSLKPVFQANPATAMVINEINYKPVENFAPGDWVELFNPYNSWIDLAGWVLKDADDDHAFTLPEGSVIPPGGFLILTRNQLSFDTLFPEVKHVYGDFDFGLSEGGDAVRLYNANGILIDQVYYLPDAPWPLLPDLEGYTLELIHPDLDNGLAESWTPVNPHGSPGRHNWPINTKELVRPALQVRSFPNPFSSQVHLSITLEKAAQVEIQLYDQNGRYLQSPFTGRLGAGEQLIASNLESLNAGIYYAKVVVEDAGAQFFKWVKVCN